MYLSCFHDLPDPWGRGATYGRAYRGSLGRDPYAGAGLAFEDFDNLEVHTLSGPGLRVSRPRVTYLTHLLR